MAAKSSGVRLTIAAATAAGTFGMMATATAAELTDVVVPVRGAPVAVELDVQFDHERTAGRVSRERNCQATATDSACPGGDTLVNQREFDFTQRTSTLNIGAAVGFPRGFELHLNLPVVVSSQQELEFASGVDGTNSSIAPNDSRIATDHGNFGTSPDSRYFNTYRFFDIDAAGEKYDKRAGLGDLSLGFDWLILSQERHPTLADVLIGFDYTAPTGDPMAAGNTGVGRGLHLFDLRVAASRKFGVVEPFMGVSYTGNIPGGSDSLFGGDGQNQLNDRPGHHVSSELGVAFHIVDEETTQRSVVLELGGGFAFTSEGLDYTPLFEPMSTSSCNGRTNAELGADITDGTPYRPDPANISAGDAACGWIAQQPGNLVNPDDPTTGEWRHSGLMVEEAHLAYNVRASLNARFHRYVGAHLGFEWRAENNHFISGDSTGVDSNDEDEFVNLSPSAGERNPNYNPTVDSVGNRFWLEGVRSIRVRAALQFFF